MTVEPSVLTIGTPRRNPASEPPVGTLRKSKQPGVRGRNPASEPRVGTPRKDLRLIIKRQRYNTYVRFEECIQDGPGQMVQ